MQLDSIAKRELKQYLATRIEEIKMSLLMPRLEQTETTLLRGRYLELETLLTLLDKADKPPRQ